MLIVSYAVSNILWGHYLKFYALFLMSQNAQLHMKTRGQGWGTRTKHHGYIPDPTLFMSPHFAHCANATVNLQTIFRLNITTIHVY